MEVDGWVAMCMDGWLSRDGWLSIGKDDQVEGSMAKQRDRWLSRAMDGYKQRDG